MKKTYLLFLLLFSLILFQECKKGSSDPGGTEPTTPLEGIINGTTWTTDTLTASITYNSTAKTKVFTFNGSAKQKQVTCTLTLNNATSGNDFTLGTYIIDANNNPLMVYSELQKNGTGNYVYVPITTAGKNEGQMVISSVDVTNKTITGTFNFTTRKINYDSNGNVTSVTNTVISNGQFNAMPYSFVSK